jgi:valyl-tRNA synthetase
MKRKDVLKFLETEKEVSLQGLYKEFEASGKSSQKRLRHILHDLEREGIVQFADDKVVVKGQKKQKNEKKQKGRLARAFLTNQSSTFAMFG